MIRDINGNEINISKLKYTIKLILKKNHISNNECVFYNKTLNNLDNRGCKSEIINNTLIVCSCDHLTDFSISQYNPVKIFKDILMLQK